MQICKRVRNSSGYGTDGFRLGHRTHGSRSVCRYCHRTRTAKANIFSDVDLCLELICDDRRIGSRTADCATGGVCYLIVRVDQIVCANH